MRINHYAKKVATNVVLPLVGFGAGWAVFNIMQEKGVMSPELQRRININNLRAQRFVQGMLPASVVEKYGYSDELLNRLIDQMEKGYTEEDISARMTFEQVLEQCGLREQIGFLEDHASEVIPYFYIADVFHSWAGMNRKAFMKGEAENGAPASTPIVRNDEDYDSEILCFCLWDKMMNGVIPFDVSIRALCVLAVSNRCNAKRLARLGSPNDVVGKFHEYLTKLEKSSTPKGDVVPASDVTAATLFYLRATNDALVHRRWVPFLGAPSTGPYPLEKIVDGDMWCSTFTPKVLNEGVVPTQAADSALLLAEIMTEKLKCADRQLGSSTTRAQAQKAD